MLDWTHLDCLWTIADAYATYYGEAIGFLAHSVTAPRSVYFLAICGQR
jgi:hypothetical protein